MVWKTYRNLKVFINHVLFIENIFFNPLLAKDCLFFL